MPRDNLKRSLDLNPNGKRDILLKDGCYLIRYLPAESVAETLFFEGTARVMRVMPDGRRVGAKDSDPIQAEIKAGADLYSRPRQDPDFSNKPSKEYSLRNPSRWDKDADKDGSSIPIFSRALYRYYLEVTKILEGTPAAGELSIFMSIHEFNQDTEWSNPGSRWVCLQKFPSCHPYKEYFSGNVLDQDSGEIVGTLSLCFISEYLRRATVVIHRVKGVESFPGDNLGGAGPSAEAAWEKAFQETGWKINLDTKSSPDLPSLSEDGIWTTSELQQALYALRLRKMAEPALIRKAEKILKKPLERMTQLEIQEQIPGLSTCPDPLDKEWLYHLLCVPRIDGFDRGVMFDTYGSDSENLPREGAAVAAEWVFGDDAKSLLNNDPADKAKAEEIRARWEPEDGKQLQAVARVYFRVAVHEVGHAMGLDHNFKDYGFMNTTDSVADGELASEKEALESNLQALQLASLPANSEILRDARRLGIVSDRLPQVPAFPGFIKLSFEGDDLNRLRFGPDVTVRPGTSFHDPGPLFEDVEPTPAEGLHLEAAPLLNSVPFGAPVRITLRITNTSNQRQQVPFSLSLKAGTIDGSVVDPNGNERRFWPLKRWEDSDPGGGLAPGETATYSITLLRGPQKALFPMVGQHRLRVRATWQRGADSLYLESVAKVRVTDPVDDCHRTAALKVISTADTLLSLALVGDQFKDGTEAIKTAMANPVLKPHFALIHAKLLLSGPNELDPNASCDLFDDGIVMSFDEIDSIFNLLSKTCKARRSLDGAKLEKAVQRLQRGVQMLRAQGIIEADRAEATSKRLGKLLNDWPIALIETPTARGGVSPARREKRHEPRNVGVEFPTGK